MTGLMEETWSWWVGSDGERYTTECETRDEAVRIAREEYDGAFIVHAAKPRDIQLSRYTSLDAGRILEDADDGAYDLADPEGDPIFSTNVTTEQAADLTQVLRAAMDQWQKKHELVFHTYSFSASQGEEWVEGTTDDDA